MSNQIRLNNNEILNVVQVNGESRFYQNTNRDTLEIVFDVSHSMDNLAEILNNRDLTRKIVIIQEGNEYVYNDYVIQVSVSRENVVVAQETSTEPSITEPRIKVVMAQQTYTEKLIEQLIGNQ